MTLKIGSLCTGYGGLDMAVREVLGGELAWVSQYEPPKKGKEQPQHAAQILAHHYDVPNHGDLTSFDWTQAEPVDVLTGGFPCQPVSNAGQRAGTDDERWLFDDIADVIAILRPRLVVLENVPGLLSGVGEIDDGLCLCGWADRRRGLLVDHPHEQELHCDRPSADVGQGGKSPEAASREVGGQPVYLRTEKFAGGATNSVAAVHGGPGGKLPERGRAASEAQIRSSAAGDGVLAPSRVRVRERSCSLECCDSGSGRSDVATVPRAEHEGAECVACSWTGCNCPVCGWPLGEFPAKPLRRPWMGAVLGTLANLRYVGRWRVVSAADVGAPHLRKRVFIVAWRSAPADASDDGFAWGRSSRLGGRGSADGGVTAADSDGGGLTGLEECHGDPAGEETDDVSGFDFDRRRVEWGLYSTAIARWEHVTGRPAPVATEPGQHGRPRLSARFVEWLMGLPPGHVTGVPGIPRSGQLHALGNGVVPRQAAFALRSLLGVVS